MGQCRDCGIATHELAVYCRRCAARRLRATERSKPTAVTLVTDPLEGPLICVGGDAPFVTRILGPRDLFAYHVEDVDGEWPSPDTGVWPPIVPAELHRYRQVVLVRGRRLYPADLLGIIGGSAAIYGSATRQYFLWQAATGLHSLTDAELRNALASPWLAAIRVRPHGPTHREVVLRE